MSFLQNILQSPHVVALLIAILIFLITIFLIVKRWIGFPVALLLLVFSLIAGLIINHQQSLQCYLNSYLPSSSSPQKGEESQDAFQKQMLQAVEDLKLEVSTEKENLRRVVDQVQEIFNSMDVQKQKLQQFIEETREKFKADYPTKEPATIPGEK
jgi:hypothetical protein